MGIFLGVITYFLTICLIWFLGSTKTVGLSGVGLSARPGVPRELDTRRTPSRMALWQWGVGCTAPCNPPSVHLAWPTWTSRSSEILLGSILADPTIAAGEHTPSSTGWRQHERHFASACLAIGHRVFACSSLESLFWSRAPLACVVTSRAQGTQVDFSLIASNRRDKLSRLFCQCARFFALLAPASSQTSCSGPVFGAESEAEIKVYQWAVSQTGKFTYPSSASSHQTGLPSIYLSQTGSKYMDVSKNRGKNYQNGWWITENPMNKWMIWGENPLLLETPFPATPGFGGVDETGQNYPVIS